MTLPALQQHIHFTKALQGAGVKAFFSQDHNAHYIQRGPFTYFARTTKTEAIDTLRGIRPRSISVLNPEYRVSECLRNAGFRQIMTPSSVAEMDLGKPTEMARKWQNALCKSQHSPIETHHRPFNMSRDAWLFAADLAQQRQKRFRAMPHAISIGWPPAATLFSTASHNGQSIAAMLFLLHGSVATYQIGWASPLARQFCAHQRLLFEAQDHLRAKSIQRLDLGSVDTENNPGLARFKIGAGATVRQLGGTWFALPVWLR